MKLCNETSDWLRLVVVTSPRHLAQHNNPAQGQKSSHWEKWSTAAPLWSGKNYSLGIESHDKICLYLVNKSCFAQIDVSLIINTHTISLEYCKIHGHFAVACPPGLGSILRQNHAIYVYKINN